MLIAIPSESAPGEHRVALTPDGAARLVKDGHEVRIEAGAGTRAGFPDSAYAAAGATLHRGAALFDGVALVCRVQAPSMDEVTRMPPGATLLAAARRRRATPPCSPCSPTLQRHRARAGAGAAHHARAVDGRAVVAEHGRRLQGGARSARRRCPSSCRCSPPRRATCRRPRCSSSAPASPACRPSPPRGGWAASSPRSTCAPRRASRCRRWAPRSSRPELRGRDGGDRGRLRAGAERGRAAAHARRARPRTCARWISSSPPRRSPGARRRG